MIPITSNREIERLERELAASREEVRRLREALQPFADAAKNLIEKSRYGYSVEHYGLVESAQGKYLGISEVYVRDFRRAAEVFQAAQANADDGKPGAG